jgi:excisionase family DNA binding protein
MNRTKRKGVTRLANHIGKKLEFDQLPDWCTAVTVARYLESGITTVYSMCHRGVLPHKRFGRLLRVPKEALRPEIHGTSLPAA